MSAGEGGERDGARNSASSAHNGPPQELRLELPAVHSAARMARHLVRLFARKGGITGSELDSLVLVASELLSNAVDHGGGKAAMVESELVNPVRMSLLLTLSAGTWEMRVSDQGGGDPAVLEPILHPQGMPDLEDERGRGFFLISQLVDELNVARSSDGLGLELIALRRHGAVA